MTIDDAPRIGTGLDSHRMEPGRRCVLGGVEIPSVIWWKTSSW